MSRFCVSRAIGIGLGLLIGSGLGACVPKGSSDAEVESPNAAAPSQSAADEAATSEIHQAVNRLYLADRHEDAEAELLRIIHGCDEKCSPSVRASGWMYVGIVRGSGAKNQEGARDAFERAVREDPRVEVDEALSTPATLETFRAVRGGE